MKKNIFFLVIAGLLVGNPVVAMKLREKKAQYQELKKKHEKEKKFDELDSRILLLLERTFARRRAEYQNRRPILREQANNFARLKNEVEAMEGLAFEALPQEIQFVVFTFLPLGVLTKTMRRINHKYDRLVDSHFKTPKNDTRKHVIDLHKYSKVTPGSRRFEAMMSFFSKWSSDASIEIIFSDICREGERPAFLTEDQMKLAESVKVLKKIVLGTYEPLLTIEKDFLKRLKSNGVTVIEKKLEL